MRVFFAVLAVSAASIPALAGTAGANWDDPLPPRPPDVTTTTVAPATTTTTVAPATTTTVRPATTTTTVVVTPQSVPPRTVPPRPNATTTTVAPETTVPETTTTTAAPAAVVTAAVLDCDAGGIRVTAVNSGGTEAVVTAGVAGQAASLIFNVPSASSAEGLIRLGVEFAGEKVDIAVAVDGVATTQQVEVTCGLGSTNIEPCPKPEGEKGWPWWLFLALGGATGVAATYAAMRHRRNGAADTDAEVPADADVI